MGKLLVKLGLWMQAKTKQIKCSWNGFVSKFMFSVDDSCANRICDCKNK